MGRSFEALKASATFDRVLFDGGEFGTATEAGSPEEEDYLGLPGLLDPDQVTVLLRKRQSAQLAARSAAAGGPPAAGAGGADGGLFAGPAPAAADAPRDGDGDRDRQPGPAGGAPQGAERPGRRVEPPDRPAARRHPQRAPLGLRRPGAPAGVGRADQGAHRQDPPVGAVAPLSRLAGRPLNALAAH